MDRRAFLTTAATASGLAVASIWPGLTARAGAQPKEFAPRPGTWRTFEVTTRVEVLKPAGVTRVWLPVPSVNAEYQKTGDSRWSGNGRVMQLMTEPKYGR